MTWKGNQLSQRPCTYQILSRIIRSYIRLEIKQIAFVFSSTSKDQLALFYYPRNKGSGDKSHRIQ